MVGRVVALLVAGSLKRVRDALQVACLPLT